MLYTFIQSSSRRAEQKERKRSWFKIPETKGMELCHREGPPVKHSELWTYFCHSHLTSYWSAFSIYTNMRPECPTHFKVFDAQGNSTTLKHQIGFKSINKINLMVFVTISKKNPNSNVVVWHSVYPSWSMKLYNPCTQHRVKGPRSLHKLWMINGCSVYWHPFVLWHFH